MHAYRNPWFGVAVIAFAIAFNIPFAVLSATFQYPAILREPAGEILTLFNAGGAPLILTWDGFAIAALLLVPVAAGISLSGQRVARYPTLAIGAAIAGGLAGLAQAIGLFRWVFVVPTLAHAYVDPSASDVARAMAEGTFSLINLYGGVAIGEHVGQLLTALFVLFVSIVALREGSRIVAWIGFITAGAITLGTGEGLAIALGKSGEAFSFATIAGFLLLTLWLIASGVSLIRGRD